MGFLSKLFKSDDSKPDVPVVTTEPTVFTGILDRTVNNLYIAGLAHHCSKKDIGFFSGVIFNEKDNPNDKKAMAIGNHANKKIVGYVPSAILSEYRDWCGCEKCPCIGFIFFDGEKLRGRVRAYSPKEDMSKVVDDAQEYAKRVCEHFGWATPNLS